VRAGGGRPGRQAYRDLAPPRLLPSRKLQSGMALLRRWNVATPNGRALVVWAYTKSEARAFAKRVLGLGKKARLPIGTQVTATAQADKLTG